MSRFAQDGTEYSFPDEGCQVFPDFDKSPFYVPLCGAEGIQAKACDILAVQNHGLYLIEAKDYAHKEAPKKAKDWAILAPEVARKAFDSLAVLTVGARQARDEAERDFCKAALACTQLYICVTVELNRNPKVVDDIERLYRRNLKERLQRLVRKTLHAKVIVTSNADAVNKDKFWTSRWCADHD